MATTGVIYKPEDCIDEMMRQYHQGKVKGTTTYNDDIDKCWTWRRKEANIWTGYSNEGKSLLLKQFALKKLLEEPETKAIFNAPEDFPPDEFYDDMIHTLTGKSTDRDNPNCIDEDTYLRAYDLIKDRFLFHYMKPPGNTIEKVLKELEKICSEEPISIVVIDPLIKFERPKDISDRDDLYASHIGSIATDFCRNTNTSFHLVMHQLTPSLDQSTKLYPEPNMYRIKGGGTWSDGFDNILTVQRPKYAQDKFDPSVIFSSQKIKKQKLVGIPQKFHMNFDRKSNRYIDKDTNVPIFNFDKFLYEKPKAVKRF